MRNRLFFIFFLIFLLQRADAQVVSGIVTDSAGNPIPYCGVSVKGAKQSTSTNQQGRYSLSMNPGTYQFICRHVGFAKMEKTVTVGNQNMNVDFQLLPQEIVMDEVVVKAGAEDPAYAIIRKAIRKREEHLYDMRSYQCEVYSKGVLNLRDFPNSFMGQNVDFEDGDTSKKKMIYLSESVSRLSVGGKDKVKTEVLSTRVSGRSNDFGFAGSRFISFYENNVRISNSINPRGFVSPISDQAMQFYKFKWEGMFVEDGQWINQIRVIPKRLYEPCFSGMIQIVENDWAIHSLQLKLLKENQMSTVDTLVVEQLFQSMGKDFWLMESQVLYPSVKFFGFDAHGSFVNVYRDFKLNPVFPKGYFDNTIIRYEEGSNQKEKNYWDSIRPIKLDETERMDYIIKDSLEQARKDPAYLDSLDRIRNKITLSNIILSGKTFSNQKRESTFTVPALIQAVGFNPAEGFLMDLPFNYTKTFNARKRISLLPHVRYGFSSRRLFGWGTIRYTTGNKYRTVLSLSAGRRVFQFNQDNPIEPLQNTISALFYKNNFMKIYSSDYARFRLNKTFKKGFSFSFEALYENRRPMENRTDFSWNNTKDRNYFPNYPTELGSVNFSPHRAFILSAGLRYQPGARYIEFPDRVINIGSRWPVFSANYTSGIKDVLGSDVDYAKWKFSINDDLNMKLAGRLFYRLETGGFLNRNRVEWQDLNHFPGNRLIRATDFLSSFQLPLYYRLSNDDRQYGLLFAEHHFNGFLTNKIPVIRKLKWNLVAGVGSLWLNAGNYAEWHVGLENIFRLFRVDVVKGYYKGNPEKMEFRISTNVTIGSSGDD